MKVILSVDSVKFPLTGIGRYTYELAKHLQLIEDVDLHYFANGGLISNLPSHDRISPTQLGGLRSQFAKSKLALSAYQVFINLRSQKQLKRHQEAIFHGPGFYLPKFSGLSAATFHDLSMFTHTQYHPPARVKFMQKELKLALQRASILITNSAYTKSEVSSYFGYPLQKIHATPLACSKEFKPRLSTESNPILSKYGLSYGNYTLFAGTIEPRKNIDSLLDAYALLPQATRRKWPLVLIGFHGWQSEKIHARIQSAVAEGWAYYFGYVSHEDIPYFFSGARLFVFPSHYEGFGLPVLEAMASGVPVVCSNVSSLPEVVGEAALMCLPSDIEALRQLIVKGLEDEDWRMLAKESGLSQSSKFSWERCAAETVLAYRTLIAGNHA